MTKAREVTNPHRKAVSNHRRRLKQRGLVRLEVQVRRADAALVRSVVKALADPDRNAEIRAALLDRFSPREGLKALLASAPLDGIDLSRARDLGRDVEL